MAKNIPPRPYEYILNLGLFFKFNTAVVWKGKFATSSVLIRCKEITFQHLRWIRNGAYEGDLAFEQRVSV